MSKRAILVVITAVFAIVVLAVVIPAFIRVKPTSAAFPCINNLRQIEVAKSQWALENSKSTNDVATWNDLRPYFPARWTNGMPICPDGGSYTIGRVGESPTCSLGDKEPGHKLP